MVYPHVSCLSISIHIVLFLAALKFAFSENIYSCSNIFLLISFSDIDIVVQVILWLRRYVEVSKEDVRLKPIIAPAAEITGITITNGTNTTIPTSRFRKS